MKKFYIPIIFLIIIAVGAVQLNNLKLLSLNKLLYYSICDQPIRYRIDIVDPKFNISEDKFLSNVNQASQIWDDSTNRNLFVYDPKGDLSINLIYDERQYLNTQINQLKNIVSADKQSLNPKVYEYEKQFAEFKQRIENLNKEIEYWNNKGGAPEAEYKKIIEEQKTLQEQANRLNEMVQSLNVSASEYNLQVNNLNKTINTFNNALEQRPEEGVFKGPENRIEIYFNISQDGLIHTLAHELGHALGLGHSQNKKAIMYFKTTQTIIPSIDDKKAVEDLCKERSYIELLKNYFLEILVDIEFSIYIAKQRIS